MAIPVRHTESALAREQGQQASQRWEPFRELDQLHDQMERLMQTMWSPTGRTSFRFQPVFQ